MLSFIKKRLANKILVALIMTIAVIMIGEITFRIYFGTKDRLDLVTLAAKELASATYAGIRYPMSIGDAEAIKKELSDIREIAKDVEVFICDFDQEIIYSSHDEKVHTQVEDFIHNKKAMRTLDVILKTGVESEPFEDHIDRKKYLVLFQPILNHNDCYHCHGSSRKVLGSMIVRVSADPVYEAVTAQRNRTLLLFAFTLPFAILLSNLIVNKFVRRPVDSLAEKAKRFAEGDTSVVADVETDDEIGVLGNTFNYMVGRVSFTSKKLEEEVKRKTSLLVERTRLLTLLEGANRELRALDKLKSTFLANMSHELRTPMNAIIGYTDLLIDQIDGPINEEQDKSLRKVAANARHLMQLINDVLDISKIESGKMKLSPKEIDFKWTIESVIPVFEPLVKKKNLTFSMNIAENLSLIYGDEDKIKQILINLLSNAIKFTNTGGITIKAKLSDRGIAPGEPPLFAEICIEDTGIGIKEEDLNKIFDKFVQVDLTAVRQYEGTGLGLSIARGLVALHKGMIWVTSKYGEGSTFCFTIPLHKELLEKPAEPVVEQRMAQGLAEYFGTPVETFLKDPEYAGKPLRCWEYVKCGQPGCPAYGSKETRCWLIHGTHCTGMKVASYPEKVAFCKGCDLIKNLILFQEEESKDSELIKISEKTTEETEKKTILAIDDNPEAIDLIRKYLGEEYSVVGLLSGEKAVQKAKDIKPLAITLDIMMPKKDGWQVLRELKETPDIQDIPVIILSIVDDQKLGFSLGAAEYLVKPIEKETLLRKLKNLEKMKKIKRVLIVDSDPETVRMIGSVLKEAEYHVTMSYNSKDAITSLKDTRPDLIVLNPTARDVGLDVVEHLNSQDDHKDIPLILVTQKDLTEKELDEIDGRIQGILNKGTLTEEDLLNELKNTIDRINK
jgi:signal transduction histidine kinase/CheY-like chemotaxis protein